MELSPEAETEGRPMADATVLVDNAPEIKASPDEELIDHAEEIKIKAEEGRHFVCPSGASVYTWLHVQLNRLTLNMCKSMRVWLR